MRFEQSKLARKKKKNEMMDGVERPERKEKNSRSSFFFPPLGFLLVSSLDVRVGRLLLLFDRIESKKKLVSARDTLHQIIRS